MRLATVFDTEINEPRPVFELPGGQRVELRELFRAPGVAENGLGGMPLYFTDLTTTVQYLDDVVAAVRSWATQRSEAAAHPLGESPEITRATAMPFCPPIPAPRAFRSFDAFAQGDEPVFSFANAGSLVGHESRVYPPRNSMELDFGLEIGLIVGTGGRDISAGVEAWNHVAGLTIVNAFAARDLQGRGSAKSRDFATAAGPYLVTLDALRDRIDSQGRIHLSMTARVNGRTLSRVDAAAMQFTWPQLIECASRDADLFNGDLISSGTFASISMLGPDKAGGWLKSGDVVELEIERLGILRTPVVARPAAGRIGSTQASPTAMA